MLVKIPESISSELYKALNQAGAYEIGGILMAEAQGENVFCLRKITIQNNQNSIFSFIRIVSEFRHSLDSFFSSTKHNYKKYNYLGEWHSHPSFSLSPSSTDESTMLDIVLDPVVGANFVILLLVKLGRQQQLEAAAYAYTNQKQKMKVQVEIEGKSI